MVISRFKLDVASSDNNIIIKEALKGLKLIYKEGYMYKKAGVIVSKCVPYEKIQLSLFDSIKDRAKYKNISSVIDIINNNMGRDKLRIASQGFHGKWNMIQRSLSPCYTTNWRDLLKVKL